MINKKTVSILVILLAVMPVSVLRAQANSQFDCSSVNLAEQNTPDKAQSAFANKLLHYECLGGQNCSRQWLGYDHEAGETDLCVLIKKWEDGKYDVSEGGILIDKIIKGMDRIETTGRVTPIKERLLQAARQKRWDILYAVDVGVLPTSDWEMRISMLGNETESDIDFVQVLRSECITENTCPEAFRSIAGLYSHGQFMERILAGLLNRNRGNTIKYLNTVDRQWTSFRKSARAMYPWEIFVNDKLYGLSKAEGFVPPPRRQLIFFHPGPGYEISDDLDSEKELLETAVLEVVGYYSWSDWKKDGSLNRPWGGSLVATWRNHQNEENLGVGAVIHLPRNWSVGVTWREGDEYSLLLGVDAAKWFTKDGKLQNRLRERLNGQ